MIGSALRRPVRILAIFAGLLLPAITLAQPREASESIGGITFDPPRRATLQLKSRQVIRGELIGVSSELVHFRLGNGKQFHYELADIRVVRTFDGEFRYTSAYDTYSELEERARNLRGVTVESSLPTAGGVPVVPMPRPDAPALPHMVDPPELHRLELEEEQQELQEASAVRSIPAIPAPRAASVPKAHSGPAQPFHETNAFKVGFLVACLAVIVLWWRNRVG